MTWHHILLYIGPNYVVPPLKNAAIAEDSTPQTYTYQFTFHKHPLKMVKHKRDHTFKREEKNNRDEWKQFIQTCSTKSPTPDEIKTWGVVWLS